MNATYLVHKAEVRLYDRLFKDEHPDANGKDHAAGKAVFNKSTGLKDTWAK